MKNKENKFNINLEQYIQDNLKERDFDLGYETNRFFLVKKYFLIKMDYYEDCFLEFMEEIQNLDDFQSRMSEYIGVVSDIHDIAIHIKEKIKSNDLPIEENDNDMEYFE